MTRSPACVLVLDADEATRALYQRTLSRIWRVVVCATESEAAQAIKRTGGRAGKETASNTTIDALVVEPATLNDSEWSFLRRLSNRSGIPIPVVICSTLDQRRLGAELGVAAYLIKPVSPQLLQATLRELLDVEQEPAQKIIPDPVTTSPVAATPAENLGS